MEVPTYEQLVAEVEQQKVKKKLLKKKILSYAKAHDEAIEQINTLIDKNVELFSQVKEL